MANTTGQKFGGREKGTPNKDTKDIRKVYSKLLEDNESKLQSLFNQVAEKNPQKAIELILKMSEFVLPKLRSTELIQDTAPINNLKIEIIDTITPLASSELKIVE
jgi:DNA-binding MurR/RpiR family transcriptional regulator